jgi:cell division septation protein DedD
VAAVKERDEANTIAQRLSTRGYRAYVMAPVNGAPRVFRVRVGKFKDRREAERIARRLEKEEQFKPWITR